MYQKRWLTLFFLSILLLQVNIIKAQQQMGSKERKALVKELKRLYQNVEEYKAMKDKFVSQRKEYYDLEKEMKRKKTELKEFTIKQENLISEEAKLIEEKRKLQEAINSGNFDAGVKTEKPDMKGTWYKVQFEMTKGDLSGLDKKMINGKEEIVFTGDTDQDGIKKYTVAYFTNEEQANELDRVLKSIKIKSKVYKYENGVRK